MSWSIDRIGKAKAIAEILDNDIKKITCIEPEESIKNLVGSIIAMALKEFPSTIPVHVQACGSQGFADSSMSKDKYNSLEVKIRAIFRFIE